MPGDNDLPAPGTDGFAEAFDEALVDAEVKHSFDPDPLVEYEPATLSIELAVISNGDGDDLTPSSTVAPVVNLAEENEVWVTSAGCSPEDATSLATAIEQGCDFWLPTPDQGAKKWNEPISLSVMPLKADRALTLTVNVRPVLFIADSDKTLLKNPPIIVTATANPRRQAQENLQQRAADALSVSINDTTWAENEPTEIFLGESADIGVQLSVPDDVDPEVVVVKELGVTTNEAAAGLTRMSPVVRNDREFTQTWSATPDQPGTYVLSFAVDGEVQLREEIPPLMCCGGTLTERTLVVRTRTVAQSPVTRAWDGTVSLAAGVATIIAGGGAAYGLVKRRRRVQAADAGSSPS